MNFGTIHFRRKTGRFHLIFGQAVVEQVETMQGDRVPRKIQMLSFEQDGKTLPVVKQGFPSSAIPINRPILRLYEWQGKPANVSIAVPGNPQNAGEASMMEDKTLAPLPRSSRHVSLPIKPFEIRTIRVHYGADSGVWTR